MVIGLLSGVLSFLIILGALVGFQAVFMKTRPISQIGIRYAYRAAADASHTFSNEV